MARARRSGDDRALAAAHTVLALVAAHDGDRLANDTHYLRALDHAERAGDVLQIIRIRLNRGSRLNEEGFHDEAIAELDLAIGLADLGGYGSFKAIALCNRGEARGALGHIDEALDDVQGSKAIFQRMGSLLVSYPLGQAGDLHAARGQTALAYAAYTEAVDVARRSGDLQGLVPALGGLARLVAVDDPERARALADEAVAASGGGLGETGALLAQAWVAHAAGDVAGAREVADRAVAIARDRRDRAAVAEAVELRAALAGGATTTPVPRWPRRWPCGRSWRVRSARAGPCSPSPGSAAPGPRTTPGGPNACSARWAPAGWPPPPPHWRRPRPPPRPWPSSASAGSPCCGTACPSPSASGSPARPATW